MNKFEEGDKKKYKKGRQGKNGIIGNGTLYSIKKLGCYFNKHSDVVVDQKDIYILPVLHNISNGCLNVMKIYNFIPEGVQEERKYTNYFNFVGERLGEILFRIVSEDSNYKNYLKTLTYNKDSNI